MKRLFVVQNVFSKMICNQYFEDKQQAKMFRKEMNGTILRDDYDPIMRHHNYIELEKFDTGYRVTYGPDHWRYK